MCNIRINDIYFTLNMQASKRKQYLWLPYTNKIKVNPKNVLFNYKGGELQIEYYKIHSILFYGDTCSLSNDFIEKCSFYNIPVTLYRRNKTTGSVLLPSVCKEQRIDILTKQILYRNNQKKCSYIAKKLLLAKFNSMSWLIEPPTKNIYKLTKIQDIVAVEAWHAKMYWQKYYLTLGYKYNRRSNNLVSTCLNAASKYISGIILRWLVYHNLSPVHGFIHIPTTYPSLAYDLMEPYRGYIDKVVYNTFIDLNSNQNETVYISETITRLKSFLDTTIYVDVTRQICTFHELYHGVTLALWSYLNGNKRFVVPMPDTPKGGRPINAGYKLYGRNAGITNFWPEAKNAAKDFVTSIKPS